MGVEARDSVAGIRRRLLALSAAVAIVLIAIVVIANYAMYHLDRTVAAAEAEIDRVTDMADSARAAQVTFKTQVQEWKNTLLRGYKPEDFKAYHDQFLARSDQVDTRLAELATEAKTLSFPTAALATLAAMHGDLNAAYAAALTRFVADDPLSVRAVDSEVRGRDRAVNDAFDSFVAAVESFADGRRAALREESRQVAANMRSTLYVSLGIGIAFVVAVAFLAMRAVASA